MNATAGWVELGWGNVRMGGAGFDRLNPFLALNLQLGGGYLIPLPINVLQLVSDRTVFSCNAHNVIYAPEYSSMQCNAMQCRLYVPTGTSFAPPSGGVPFEIGVPRQQPSGHFAAEVWWWSHQERLPTVAHRWCDSQSHHCQGYWTDLVWWW